MAYSGATPDSVAQARKMAQALMSQGMSGQPVQHWTQALGRVLQAGVGSMWDSQAAQGETAGKAEANAQLAAALQADPKNPQAAIAGMTSPWLGDARTELSQALVKQKLGLGADKPAVIQNYEYRKNLTPEQQAVFDQVQRSQQYLNTGTEHVNARNPGQRFQIDNITPARDKAAGAEQGTAQAKAQFNLPQVEAAAARMLKQIEELETDTSLDSITGLVGGRIAEKYHTEGMSRAQSRVNQIAGGTFLQAYNELRGGGAITEEEGKQAKASYTRLANQTMGTPDYRKALAEAREETLKLVELAKRKAAGAGASAPAARGDGWTDVGGVRIRARQ
jgi:predicted negative regulator of RcsB-dependent stress response